MSERRQPSVQDLSCFRLPPGFRGRSGLTVLLWQIIQATLFGCSPQPFYGWRRLLLRLFGAKIGRNVLLRPSVRVTYPWKLAIGDHSWVGDRAELYSLGPIRIGANVVISQRTYLCGATHDYRQIDFPIVAPGVVIEDQAWLAADVFVAPGIRIGMGAVVGARASIFRDIPPYAVTVGTPARIIGSRRSA